MSKIARGGSPWIATPVQGRNLNSLKVSREIRRVWKKVLTRWEDGISVSQCRKVLSAWYPILLKRAFDAIEGNEFNKDIGSFFEHECAEAEVYSLVDKAIERDPAVFIR